MRKYLQRQSYLNVLFRSHVGHDNFFRTGPAIFIQTVVRKYLQRCRYMKMKWSLFDFAALFYVLFLTPQNICARLSTFCSSWFRMHRECAKAKIAKNAVIKCQSVVRSHLRSLAFYKIMKMTLTLQAAWRGNTQRKSWQRLVSVVVNCQSWHRCNEVQRHMKIRRAATITIQVRTIKKMKKTIPLLKQCCFL